VTRLTQRRTEVLTALALLVTGLLLAVLYAVARDNRDGEVSCQVNPVTFVCEEVAP
jgi:hypothetical protein